jgi:hypothetical protein
MVEKTESDPFVPLPLKDAAPPAPNDPTVTVYGVAAAIEKDALVL